MTTAVVVKANHGWAVNVSKIDPKTGVPIDHCQAQVVDANTERTVYCHIRVDLLIYQESLIMIQEYTKAANQSYNHGRLCGSTINAAKPSAPVDRVDEALKASANLAERVSTLVDRIIGSAPEPQCGAASQFGPPDVLGGLLASADEAASHIASANDALERLARAFGL